MQTRLTPIVQNTLLAIFAALFSAAFFIEFIFSPDMLNFGHLLCETGAVLLPVGVTQFGQPLYNLLSLIGVMLLVGYTFIYAGQEFIGYVFIIVYLGAVAILFLFVIMLLDIKSAPASAATLVGSVFSVLLFIISDDWVDVSLVGNLQSGQSFAPELFGLDAMITYARTFSLDILQFSQTLYTEHAVLFGLISGALFVAMLGAIVLAAPLIRIKPRSEKRRRPMHLRVEQVIVLFPLVAVVLSYISFNF